MGGDIVVRLSQLICALSAHPGEGLSSQELANLCGAAHEVVNADLEMLSSCFPIYFSPEDTEDFKQPRLWYYEELGRHVQPAFRLSVKETMELLACLEAEHDPIICGIRSQLEHTLLPSGEDRERIRSQQRCIYKGGKPPYDALQPSERIYQLAQLCGRRRLVIQYKKQNGELSKRSIDPLGLVYCWTTGAWYLVAYSLPQKDYRNFRVGRILSYQELGAADSYETFSLKDYLAPAWGVQVAETIYEVKIRFYDDYNVHSRVRRETQGRSFAKLEKEPSGTLLYTDLVAGLKEIRVWVRSFGASAEVLEPEKLRKELIDSYQRILERCR